MRKAVKFTGTCANIKILKSQVKEVKKAIRQRGIYSVVKFMNFLEVLIIA